MQLLTRSSPWRQLFPGSNAVAGVSTPAAPQALDLLQQLLNQLPADLQSNQVKSWQLDLVKLLKRFDLPAWRISQVISDHNRWLYHRALEESLTQMQSHGWGEPPVTFSVVILGSGARSESLLRPDQDNALLLDNYPVARHQEIDTWFQHLGELFTTKLADVGIPLCKGHVMARWPLWRKPLQEWQEQLTLWMSGRLVKHVQLANILFDFSTVYGQSQLEKRLRQHIEQRLPQAGGFLHEMSALLDEIPVGLDAWDRLVSPAQEAPHSFAFHLKRQALLPLQSALRLACLLKGELVAGSSQDRLTSLVAKNCLTPQQAKDLSEALQNLQALLLQQQLSDLEAGRQPDAWLDRRQLSERSLQLLKLDLKLIKGFVQATQKNLGHF